MAIDFVEELYLDGNVIQYIDSPVEFIPPNIQEFYRKYSFGIEFKAIGDYDSQPNRFIEAMETYKSDCNYYNRLKG